MCCLCDECDCFCGTLRAGCCILVFVAVPIAVIALVALRSLGDVFSERRIREGTSCRSTNNQVFQENVKRRLPSSRVRRGANRCHRARVPGENLTVVALPGMCTFCTDFLRELDEKNAAENCEISMRPPSQAAPV
ncbi:hypothetical protein DdX_12615 [Ditylenchus destructor]|uniref:Uncharacterized protein n=1 Tax=Ditylenchus destructor TaxID=166010 RepID=A0AAD4MUE1_9BILA|nr:hypothetical protein DdX_12615 [Ditylenchus destructor]